MARLIFAGLAHPHMKPSWTTQFGTKAPLIPTAVDSGRQQMTQTMLMLKLNCCKRRLRLAAAMHAAATSASAITAQLAVAAVETATPAIVVQLLVWLLLRLLTLHGLLLHMGSCIACVGCC